jgi:hypothetical protein
MGRRFELDLRVRVDGASGLRGRLSRDQHLSGHDQRVGLPARGRESAVDEELIEPLFQ